jgi:hypothetical protein
MTQRPLPTSISMPTNMAVPAVPALDSESDLTRRMLAGNRGNVTTAVGAAGTGAVKGRGRDEVQNNGQITYGRTDPHRAPHTPSLNIRGRELSDNLMLADEYNYGDCTAPRGYNYENFEFSSNNDNVSADGGENKDRPEYVRTGAIPSFGNFDHIEEETDICDESGKFKIDNFDRSDLIFSSIPPVLVTDISREKSIAILSRDSHAAGAGAVVVGRAVNAAALDPRMRDDTPYSYNSAFDDHSSSSSPADSGATSDTTPPPPYSATVLAAAADYANTTASPCVRSGTSTGTRSTADERDVDVEGEGEGEDRVLQSLSPFTSNISQQCLQDNAENSKLAQMNNVNITKEGEVNALCGILSENENERKYVQGEISGPRSKIALRELSKENLSSVLVTDLIDFYSDDEMGEGERMREGRGGGERERQMDLKAGVFDPSFSAVFRRSAQATTPLVEERDQVPILSAAHLCSPPLDISIPVPASIYPPALSGPSPPLSLSPSLSPLSPHTQGKHPHPLQLQKPIGRDCVLHQEFQSFSIESDNGIGIGSEIFNGFDLFTRKNNENYDESVNYSDDDNGIHEERDSGICPFAVCTEEVRFPFVDIALSTYEDFTARTVLQSGDNNEEKKGGEIIFEGDEEMPSSQKVSEERGLRIGEGVSTCDIIEKKACVGIAGVGLGAESFVNYRSEEMRLKLIKNAYQTALKVQKVLLHLLCDEEETNIRNQNNVNLNLSADCEKINNENSSKNNSMNNLSRQQNSSDNSTDLQGKKIVKELIEFLSLKNLNFSPIFGTKKSYCATASTSFDFVEFFLFFLDIQVRPNL